MLCQAYGCSLAEHNMTSINRCFVVCLSVCFAKPGQAGAMPLDVDSRLFIPWGGWGGAGAGGEERGEGEGGRSGFTPRLCIVACFSTTNVCQQQMGV